MLKLIMVGLGSFGLDWYQAIDRRDFQVVVVDTDIEKAALLAGSSDTFYTSLETALEKEKPDLLLNLTPPGVHSAVNRIAFAARLPVLCEKPIAEDYHEAKEIVQLAEDLGIPLMIAENFRRKPVMRKLRKVIEDRLIGSLASVQVHFFKETAYDKPYLQAMRDPLLVDVAVHHLDMLRYLTGSEGRRIYARNYHPQGSHYRGNAGLSFILEMQDGVVITYAGSLSAKTRETSWNGDWRIEGTLGVLALVDDCLSLTFARDDKTITLDDFSDLDNTTSCLEEFLNALSEKRDPETSGRDYLKTQALVHFAGLSSASGKVVEIE
jgi:predicted dehydrogenase